MLFSRPCSYAIRALTYLAKQPPGKLSGTREISEQESIPSPFLGKVLLQLRRSRLVRSYKGIGGGYELALPPDKISLLAVVLCFEGNEAFEQCVLEDRDCLQDGQCPLCDCWIGVRHQLVSCLRTKTLAEVVRQQEGKTERSAPAGKPAAAEHGTN